MSPANRTTLDFALIYAAAIAGVVAVAYLMQDFFGFRANGGASAVPLIAATLGAGSSHASRTGEAPAGGLAWSIALRCTLASVVVSLAALALAVLAMGDAGRSQAAVLVEDPSTTAVISVTLLVFYTVAIRFLLPLGAKLQIRAAEKRRKP